MNVPFLDLTRMIRAIRPQLDGSLAAAVESGRFMGGVPVEEFEHGFAAFCGARHCVGVGSGTDAITLCLRALGVGAGDEVITAANTCIPTVIGIEASGATPVLVDVEQKTFTLDPLTLGGAITSCTRAIVPVHLYGQCADMDQIVAFARAHGLKVVEDAAQAHGAAYRGRRAGTLADAAAFSFYPTKNLGALGQGGAVVTDTHEIADYVRLLQSLGATERDHTARRGVNSQLDTIQAAVLCGKLGLLDDWNERRRTLAGLYHDALCECGANLPLEAEERFHVYHLFVIRVPERDRLRSTLLAAGIETLVHYPLPVHSHEAYSDLAHPELEMSEQLAGEVLSLPLHPGLRDEEVEYVAQAIHTAL